MKNVHVIDTLSLSTGIALLGIYAKELVDAGASVDEIVEKVKARIPYVQASFVVERLDYLYKGGRCSSLMYFGANILKIRPQILLKDGKMVSGNKYRGNMSIICKKYLADVLNEFSNPDLEEVFITYTTCDANIVESIKESLYNYGFKNVNITRAGGTITSHCGEECLGVLYINDGGVN
jgi:DegV family protein with EDD domain